jgi:hypothetical protein
MTDEELWARLEAWEPLVSSGHIVSRAGQDLRQAADRLKAQAKTIEALQADKAKLRKVVEASEGLKRDLLHRAKWDDDAKVVCAGTSAWLRFTEALEALEKQP